MKGKKIYIFCSMLVLLLILTIIGYYIWQNRNGIQSSSQKTNINIEYSQEELTGEWKEYSAKITLSDEKISVEGSGVTNNGNTIVINSAGTYYITGSISDGTIQINAGKEDEVQLVLDNASITSKTTAPINGIKAKKLTITLADNSENTITDSSNYTEFTDEESKEPDGAIFTKTDLVINGSGNLTVNANYEDGIVSKDGLKIINCNINVNSQDDAIRGKDYVAINGANLNITSKEDAIKSKNDSDEELGYIVIDDANITINAGDDGIHAEHKIVINSGEINISKSYEGIESEYIEINGGTINVVAEDDGINVAGGNNGTTGRMGENNFSQNDSSNRKLVINGGNITVNATGDGLDSNGSIYINGGTILVIGPTSGGNGALDYDKECIVTGGDIIIYGSTGMWQNPSNTSTQYSLTFQVSGKQGDELKLVDEDGNEIASVKTEKTYGGITFSNSKIQNGKKYTLYVNGNSTSTLEVNNIVTSDMATNGMGGMNGGRGMENRNTMNGENQMQGEKPTNGGKPMQEENTKNSENSNQGDDFTRGENPISGDKQMKGKNGFNMEEKMNKDGNMNKQ
ncbi:MAG: carbohydrate-binding domain-containing protein [Clostridia bacterium]|nr:carbohydrate-binding domain-containing protein [Clostridia bacterium]